jgi:hypothetical protein
MWLVANGKGVVKSVGVAVLLAASALAIPLSATHSANALTAGIVTTGLALNLDPNDSASYPGSGTTVTDLSGANRHGTLLGNSLPTFNNASPKSFQFTKTYVGNTASADNKIRVGGKFLTDNFTIQAWIKTSEVGYGPQHYKLLYIMASECGGGADDWGFGVNNSGKLAFGAGRNDATHATPDNVNTNTWVNVAASRTKSTGHIRLYINGVFKTIGTGNSGNSLTCSADGNTWIGNGQDAPAYTFGGSIGSVLAYTGVLSDADILANYNATSGTYVPVAPASTAVPVIEGTARNGDTLTSSPGTWTGTPTSWTYQWKRSLTSGGSFVDITGATSRTYVVDESDVGYFIKVSVIATNSVGSSSASGSLETLAVVDIAPTNTAIPVITGTARTGETLTSSKGSWNSAPTPSTTYEYQWKRANAVDGTYTNIASAVSRTYDLTDADIDKFIKVSVIATNSIGASLAVLSGATSAVLDLNDSVVPTASTPVSTTTGFTFSIPNYSTSYTYSLTTTKGSVSRSDDDVTVTGLTAGESATVTISVSRSTYKPASKTVTGTATAALTIVIQAPASAPAPTVTQGQLSVVTVAPTATTLPVLNANGVPIPTTTTTSTTVAVAQSRAVVTTTVPAIVTTTTLGPPTVDKVSTGESAVQVDGVDTKAQVSRVNNQLVISAGALKATIGGVNENGSAMSLDSDGNVRLRSGDVVRIKLGGFKPGSTIEAWLFSTPVLMGTSVVGVDGSVTGNFVVPKNAARGAHRIVVVAKSVDGKPTTFTVGIAVGEVPETSTFTRVLIAIPIALAIGFGFLLPTQLRRRRKVRPA